MKRGRKPTLYYLVSEDNTFAGTGIARVAKQLYRELRLLRSFTFNIQPVFITKTGNLTHCARYQKSSQKSRPLSPQSGDVILSVDLVHDLTASAKKSLLTMQANGVALHFVVHDLMPLQNPQWFAADEDNNARKHYLAQFEGWANFVTNACDSLICVSQHVAEQVKQFMGISTTRCRPRVCWFHLGTHFARVNGSRRIKRPKANPTFLMVGTLEPRKCQHLALEAFTLLWEKNKDLTLVLAGRAGGAGQNSGRAHMSAHQKALLSQIAGHPEYGTRLLFVEGPDDKSLRKLYNQSSVLLMISRDEGFGLPLIEAAQLGVPIIARDIPVFKEVCGRSAYYFNGETAFELADAIISWNKIFQNGKHPTPHRIKPNSWRKSALQLAKIINRKGDCRVAIR
jgi:glycosyltransferase involved in cell wall biosynthesis